VTVSVFSRADRALERARHAVEDAEVVVEIARRRRREARLRRMLVIGRPRPRPGAEGPGDELARHARRTTLQVDPAVAARLRERLGGPHPA
jgi:hypothetical protein